MSLLATRPAFYRALSLGCPFLVFLLIVVSASAQRGANTAPVTVVDMVDESGIIIRGNVVSTVVEPHPRYTALWTVVVTLHVDESLKGQVGETYTFRQFIWDLRDREDAAGYRKGENLLLFLLMPNANGLSSPSGLEQGRFRIFSDVAGNLSASNGRGNVGLLAGVAARASAKGMRLSARAASIVAATPSGPIAFSDLRELILQLAGGN